MQCLKKTHTKQLFQKSNIPPDDDAVSFVYVFRSLSYVLKLLQYLWVMSSPPAALGRGKRFLTEVKGVTFERIFVRRDEGYRRLQKALTYDSNEYI